mmetsp:Transcript_10732/g.45026  ORF Transcript_10732/g.45026 Transcript_10732/m.45026 type:complete len:603 (+) Transcript_10732:20-1828(+)
MINSPKKKCSVASSDDGVPRSPSRDDASTQESRYRVARHSGTPSKARLSRNVLRARARANPRTRERKKTFRTRRTSSYFKKEKSPAATPRHPSRSRRASSSAPRRARSAARPAARRTADPTSESSASKDMASASVSGDANRNPHGCAYAARSGRASSSKKSSRNAFGSRSRVGPPGRSPPPAADSSMSSSALFPGTSLASTGVPRAAASSSAPLCPSDRDVFSTPAAARMYSSATRRATGGTCVNARAPSAPYDARAFCATSDAYGASSEGPITASTKAGDEEDETVDEEAITLTRSSTASAAQSTSFTGRSPAGSRNTGVDRCTPSASCRLGTSVSSASSLTSSVFAFPVFVVVSKTLGRRRRDEPGEGKRTPCGTIAVVGGSAPEGAAATIDGENATTTSAAAARRASVAARSGASRASTLTSVPPSTSTTLTSLVKVLPRVDRERISASASSASPHLNACSTTQSAKSPAFRNASKSETPRGKSAGARSVAHKPVSSANTLATRPIVTPFPPSAMFASSIPEPALNPEPSCLFFSSGEEEDTGSAGATHRIRRRRGSVLNASRKNVPSVSFDASQIPRGAFSGGHSFPPLTSMATRKPV